MTSERAAVVSHNGWPRGVRVLVGARSRAASGFRSVRDRYRIRPFWLHWTDAAGKPVSHAPDFFARRTDGSAVVLDCRPAERRPPRDVAKFDAAARACALVGWEYRLVGAADAIVRTEGRGGGVAAPSPAYD